MDIDARLVPLQGSFNFRDLGGYRGSGGRLTRWGQLYRADALHELTPVDIAQLGQLGLRTIVDLRTERELARTGRGPMGSEDVGFHHLAVVREGVRGDGTTDQATDRTADRTADRESIAAPAPAGDDLAERYLWYLEVGRDSLVEALTLLGGDENYPLVFHCAAGKDRTGVLAALILSILGVDRQEIVADYVLTAERLPFIIERWLADPAFAERMASVPATRFSVEAPTMEGFLDQLETRFGGARAWALDAGVSVDVLDRIAHLMLEPGG